ncbi:unnamed protein product [Cochlearia groenlandica]
MIREDPKFKGGWKFEHVWNIVKNFEKFQDGVVPPKRLSIPCGFDYTSLESNNPNIDSPMQVSPGGYDGDLVAKTKEGDDGEGMMMDCGRFNQEMVACLMVSRSS